MTRKLSLISLTTKQTMDFDIEMQEELTKSRYVKYMYY